MTAILTDDGDMIVCRRSEGNDVGRNKEGKREEKS
jgi:hypothetical protein